MRVKKRVAIYFTRNFESIVPAAHALFILSATGTKTKEEKFMNELSKQINVESEETGTSMEVDEDGSG